MPISIEEFESRDPTNETDLQRVVRFLARNRDKAYEADEIAAATDVSTEAIRPLLRRLADQGLVRHKEPYWALGDPAAVRDAAVFSSAVSSLDELLGPESRTEWLEAGEPGE